MAKRTKKRPGSSTGLVRVTKQKVIDGLPGPGGVRIRHALPEEADKVTALLKTAADDLETGHLEALAEGRCGMWLLDGLAGARLVEPLVRAAADDVKSAAAAMSLPLVAQDRDGNVVGALLAVPSGTVISTVSQLPGHGQHALLSMLKYAKIKAVAVGEEARGRGIGAALLKRCVQLYWQLDYMLLFGEFDTERELGPYYTRQGFTVLRPGETIDVGTVLAGVPIQLGAGPGETLFHRWRGRVR
ncbi:GNAT family N-acetyltransferase [Streptomyces sp. ISL-22]|uniref:GNAT family N-acetyltransferase n=1 Tax=unclassified Streptomyces TaxID=2593676 RepID=UPI001BE8E075|nr:MULTISPECIES: GNAT family N-acetyltransferase [unclassified Streptomyces]MBT2423693.1 GNAT family N-acetyltransferase [Streptomyces sp. ISL-24]MBT2438367.1 GNAT family N-acetyltransferase [Streptomyces sp. ISL-22]